MEFSISGDPGDVVGLHAIDEAVLAHMNSDMKMGFKHFEKALKDKDIGCGPGVGRSSAHIIRNAGFVVLSTDSRNIQNLQTHKDELCNKRSQKKRSYELGSQSLKIKKEVKLNEVL